MFRGRKLRKLALAVVLYYLTFHMGFALAAAARWDKNPTARIDLQQKGVFNAGKTGHTDVDGFDRYLRNLSGQSVHSNFFLNTNSCASCHMTHSGQGEKLLFQASVYNTCSACHFDASLNTYNLLGGSATRAGRFFDGDFDLEERDGISFHLATGKKRISDAPGADASASDQPFTCGSCHAPHGSYGGRHLQVNPNGRATRYQNRPLVPDAGTEGRFRPDVPQDTAPWLYYDADSAYAGGHGLVIRHESGEIATDKFFVHYREGYVEVLADYRDEILADAINGRYRISFSQALVVDIEIVTTNGGEEESLYRSGTVAFCTACHSGYLGQNSDGQAITIHQNFTHQLNEDLSGYLERGDITADSRLKLERDRSGDGARLVCLTCHFAHGTDAGLMTDRDFNPLYTADGPDVPADTHLLRFGQQEGEWEACYTCHDSGGPRGENDGTGAEELVAADEEPPQDPPEDAHSSAPEEEDKPDNGPSPMEPAEAAPVNEGPAPAAELSSADSAVKREDEPALEPPAEKISIEP